MKNLFLILLSILTFQLYAQPVSRKYDIRFGVGTSMLGTGDIKTVTFENELNYKINRYFTSSASLNFGKSLYNEDFANSSYIQANLNLFLSPFKNIKRNDFRIGGGLSVMNVTGSHLVSRSYSNGGVLEDEDYLLYNWNSYGFNLIIEDDYKISEHLLVGLKLFIQPYTNGDINVGKLLKLGYVL